jgi:hypothetical protein
VRIKQSFAPAAFFEFPAAAAGAWIITARFDAFRDALHSVLWWLPVKGLTREGGQLRNKWPAVVEETPIACTKVV